MISINLCEKSWGTYSYQGEVQEFLRVKASGGQRQFQPPHIASADELISERNLHKIKAVLCSCCIGINYRRLHRLFVLKSKKLSNAFLYTDLQSIASKS